MGYEFFIAKRYLRMGRGSLFLSMITSISILGVFLGVASLLVVLAVMSGFQKDLRDKILGTNSHVIVLKFNNEPMDEYREILPKVREFPSVIGESPFIFSKAMIEHKSYADGIAVRGVDPGTMAEVTDIADKIVVGSMDFQEDSSIPGIVVGVDLADNLRAYLGDTLTLASPLNVTQTPVGSVPRMKKFQVVGMFDAGMYEYNTALAYISLNSAQKFLGMGAGVTGIEVKLENLYEAPRVADEIAASLGFPYRTTDWVKMNRNLFAALKLEKTTMFIILTLIIIVAAFNIIATLVMLVIQKTKEIGILKSMGATQHSIMRIFMLDGLTIGGIGTLLGVLGGILISWLLSKYKFISLPADVYFIDRLPVHMEVFDFILVALSALVITFLATLYPAFRASQLTPVEAIRAE
jgi:lipoprotein-releasing system permease protein